MALSDFQNIPQGVGGSSQEILQLLKYLSSYLSSDVDGGTSIHSEEWVEIENAEQVDLLSSLGSLLIKIDSPEPTYNKYFLVRAE